MHITKELIREYAVNLAFKVSGVRQEFPELNREAAVKLMILSRLHTLRHHTEIVGRLPREGAAILTGNHTHESDSLKTVDAGRRTAGRLTGRTVVKMSLVEPNTQESPEYLASIGDKHDELNHFNRTRADVLKGVGVIPIMRDNPGTSFLKECDAVLGSGQLLGIFMQPTRYSDCLLRNLQPGAAILARRHPNVPVYPIAFSGPPDGRDKMVTLPSFTYAELSKMLNRRISAAELTIMIADMIASGLPPRVQRNWLEVTRAAEAGKLNSSRPLTTANLN